MPTPIEIMERLQGLPEHLRAHHRRFIVEAVTEETRAPMVEFYRQREIASEAAITWAKAHGAEGFYPPHTSHGHEGKAVSTFSWKAGAEPTGSAWTKAARGYQSRPGYVAMYPSRRPAGKVITAELDQLPKFPGYAIAVDHLGAVADLTTERGSSAVGLSDGKMHWTVPCRIRERMFIDAVNHNYDIARDAERAAEYLAGEHPEWAHSLDYQDDPINWRPPAGWKFRSRSEFEFILAEARLQSEREKAVA